MKNIEDYGFDRSDLVIATAVNSYLKKLMPEAREETLAGIVRQDGAKTTFNGERVVALMIGSEGWKDGGDPLMVKTLAYIREQLPAVDGEEYIKKQPEKFLRFIEDWTKQ